MAHKLSYWEDKSITIEESKKYSSRTEFCKNSYGAYRVSKKNGWLDEMTWLNRKNVYKDSVDVVYRYYFADENSIYVGRTIYPELRDKQHRTREYDTVYKFSKEHEKEVPKMEILEEGLTVIEGAKRESYWANYYTEQGFTLLNKQPCGSLGYMAKGKWSKKKCFEEAKKYTKRSDFQRHSSQAYHISMKNGWIDEMDWLPKNNAKPSGYWKNKENFLEEAKKYSSRNEMCKANLGAYNAGLKYGYFNEVTWMEKRESLPFYYWKDKEHVMEEAKKYSSKNEFQKANQSAYGAARKYGYLKDMPWLVKNKVTPKGTYKNKEFIMNEGKKYKTRGEFQKNDKSAYSAALHYGWLDEMTWLEKSNHKPKGYWDNIENVINEAKKYTSKMEIKEKASYLYKIMFKKGYIDKLTWLK